MLEKPVTGSRDNLIKGARLLEEMCGARNDMQMLWTVQCGVRPSLSSNTPVSAAGKQRQVKNIATITRLFLGQKIEQQCRYGAVLKLSAT